MTDPDLTQTPRREHVIGNGLAWLSKWSGRWVLIALGAVLLSYVVSWTWSILLPIALAMIITTVLQPVSDLLISKARFPRALAAGAVLVGSIAIVIGIGFAIAPSVAGQTDDIASDAASGLQEIQDWVQEKEFVSKDQIDTALESVQDRIRDSAGGIASGVLNGVGAVGSVVVTFVLALVLVFLFLKDGHKFRPWVSQLAGPRAGHHLDEVLSQSWQTLGSFIRVQALVSAIDAVLIGIALLLVGVPLAIPLAIVTFFAGFIPIAGAFIAGGLAVLIALVSVGWSGALIMLIVIIAVQQLEGNVLSPMLQSKSMQLHPAVVLMSVTLAGTLFGIIGAFLAVPVVAIAAVILRYLNQQVTETATPPPALPASLAPLDTSTGPRDDEAEPERDEES